MNSLLPLITLLVGSIVVYIVGRFTHSKAFTGIGAVIILVVAGYYSVAGPAMVPEYGDMTGPAVAMEGGHSPMARGSTITSVREAGAALIAEFDHGALSIYLAIAAIGLSAIVSLYSIGYMGTDDIGKFYGLLLMMTGGMVGIGLAGDLFNLFVMFELMSLSSFGLVAFERDKWEPVEAGVKYVLMSAIGSMVALLGIILVFTFTGTLDLQQLQTGTLAVSNRQLALTIAALFIGGFGVKAALVPMHTWLPDAHSAAPSGISAMLSGIVISAGLLTMVKALSALGGLQLGMVLVVFAVLTMFVGNFMAWVQTDLKRMLAYSSIAHIGYILVGVGVAFAMPAAAAFGGMRGGLFHILNHAVMKGGAFLCAGAVLSVLGTRDMDEMAGIGSRIPLLGICFGVFVLALVGTPPLNGFVSKLFICKGALLVGGWGPALVILVILNSALSLFYYIPALNKVLFGSAVDENEQDTDFELPASMAIAIFILALLTLLLGLVPDYGLEIVDPAAHTLAAMLG